MKRTKTAFLLSCLVLCLATPSCAGNVVGTGEGGSPASTGTGSTDVDCSHCGPGEMCATVDPTAYCPRWHCVACSPTSGPVCDVEGNVYTNQCDALMSGKGFGLPCPPPGKVLCFGSPPTSCDPSTEVCVEGYEDDCGSWSPAQCTPLYVDAGLPDGG